MRSIVVHHQYVYRRAHNFTFSFTRNQRFLPAGAALVLSTLAAALALQLYANGSRCPYLKPCTCHKSVSAATETAVKASISTPVPAVVRARESSSTPSSHREYEISTKLKGHRVTHRYQLRCAFGRLDPGNPGNFEGVTFGIAGQGRQNLRAHNHPRAGLRACAPWAALPKHPPWWLVPQHRSATASAGLPARPAGLIAVLRILDLAAIRDRLLGISRCKTMHHRCRPPTLQQHGPLYGIPRLQAICAGLAGS